MKKVVVHWIEIHKYEAEVEIPEGMTKEEELDYVSLNSESWEIYWREPYAVDIDWDSFEVEDVE